MSDQVSNINYKRNLIFELVKKKLNMLNKLQSSDKTNVVMARIPIAIKMLHRYERGYKGLRSYFPDV